MKILVTGANGFSARYLIEHLSQHGCGEIYRTDLMSAGDARFFQCDLAQENQVATLIQHVEPDQIYHLAGTFTNDYQTDYDANVLSSRNLLETVRASGRRCRLLLIGSCAEYGSLAAAESPVSEEHQLLPVSIYGLTKVYQTYLAKFYVAVHKLDVVIARPFNLLGPGMSSRLFVGHVYEQIAAYRKGEIAKISVGNLESRRDYISVKDAVCAYATIMQSGAAGEVYNVGSGSSVKIRDLLERLLKENGLGMEVVEQMHPAMGNKVDISDLFADVRKLSSLSSPTATRKAD